ncbi:MAG: ABC transporter permease [Candidatus Eisenbacteria bacterium]|jgi:phospholipid/cholesterol/gamma-HCH transport system permease protein|uniref:ABC transporter permease n=1 Tax=Eiseniibacteriota bacterium TaxID=2212470 RepID=A0A538TNJ6_UNCEI|nr:MAG: ABC transporter permease [Candidatus Eisenbacteria bacterium]
MGLLSAFVEWLRRTIQSVQEFTLFSIDVIRATFSPPFYGREMAQQLYFAGIGSLLIVVVSSVVAGQALALQLVRELAASGAKSQLGHFQVISVVRALGPILTGMVVAARMSAGITAEIGAMRSSDQIDALVAFGADPMKRLVVPRLVALLAALPALVIIADTLGVLGGGLVGTQYHLTWDTYMNGVLKYLTPKNLLVGMIKPFIFAIMIVIVACWKGFTSAGGAKGVGVSTTQSVVISSVGILVTDGICTRLIFKLLHW